MRKPLALAAILALSPFALAQSDIEPAKSPKEIMREFVKLELEGARLTPEGRRETATFLVLPSAAPPYPINIVSDKFDVHEIPSTKNNPKLNVYFPYLYGQLDSALRFKEALHVTPGNGLIREGINAEYDLVLTKNRELEPDKREGREIAGARVWRIENAPSFCTIKLETAIRYVSEMQEKTTDPTVKENASQALAKLKKLL